MERAMRAEYSTKMSIINSLEKRKSSILSQTLSDFYHKPRL